MNNNTQNSLFNSPKMLVNTRELAQMIGFSESVLRAWRVKGIGPKFIKIGSAVKYRVKDIEDFIEDNCRHNTLY